MAVLRNSSLLRRLRSAASLVLLLGLVALLWPSSLGGQVGYVMVSGTSMEPGLHTGDLVLVRSAGHYAAGDTIAYRVPEGDVGAGQVVIHRIIGGDGQQGYVTQGDNRQRPDVWRPTDGDVVGRRWTMVPAAAGLLGRLRNPLPLALAAAALTLVLVALPSRPEAAAQAPANR